MAERSAAERGPRTTADRERLDLAKDALVRTGYFTADQVGDDIAPRIIELWAAAGLDVERLAKAIDASWADLLAPLGGLPDGLIRSARAVAAEYARLASADEEKP